MKKRYYNNNVGPIKENELKAFKKALELSKELKNINQIVLLIHTKSNTGYIERIFGTRDVKKLFNGVKIDPNYPPIKIETVRTFNENYQTNIIVLALGLRSNELSKYDDFENVKAIIAHQWAESSIRDWAKSWGAIDLETATPIEKTKLPENVVKNAFASLTRQINLTTGIRHSMDNELCKTYLRALNKYNYDLNSKEIFSYLTTELNWESDDANEVIELIDKLNSGGYFKGGAKIGLKDFIVQWKS